VEANNIKASIKCLWLILVIDMDKSSGVYLASNVIDRLAVDMFTR